MTSAAAAGQAELTEIACEILGYLRRTHRRPGARLSIEELADHFGTDPAIATALSYWLVADTSSIRTRARLN
jgi:hypothetical protein